MIKKIIIGIAGAEHKSGCTHTALTISNFLKNRSLKTAIVECNDSGAFEEIRETAGQLLGSNNCFQYNNLDFYPFANSYILSAIFARPYQFVVLDMGDFRKCDKMLLARCDVKIIVCGSKPWEVTALDSVFSAVDEETLKSYNFYFMFTSDNKQTRGDIIKGMDTIKNVFFPEYTENPFIREAFPGVEHILGSAYLSVNGKEEKTASNRKIDKPKFFGRKNISEPKEEPPAELHVEETTQQEAVSIQKPENNVTVNTLLGDDVSYPKKKTFNLIGGILPKQRKNFMEIDETVKTVCDLHYSLEAANDIIIEAKGLIKLVRSLSEEFPNKKLLATLSFRIYQNAFCAGIRAGALHTRESSIDGYPTLNMNIRNQPYFCNEDIVRKILGEDQVMIKPYEDNHIEL